jgi:guanine nucleotide-binding protein G(I)/G(S)/G(T) subunit beta-1
MCSLYDLESGSVLRELSSHDGYLSCCRFLRDETQILTSSGDSTCILWDVERSIPIVHFNDHSGDVMSVSLRPGDEDCFISGSSDGTVKVWDVRLDKATTTYASHESDVTGVAFHSGSHVFASSCDDAACRLFDLRAVDVLNVFSTPKVVCGVSSVELSAVRLSAGVPAILHCNAGCVSDISRVDYCLEATITTMSWSGTH